MAGETLPPVVAVLQGDISDLVAKIAEAKAEVESLDDVKGTPTVDLDIAPFETALAEVEAQLRAFSGMAGDVTLGIQFSDPEALAQLMSIDRTLNEIANAMPIEIPAEINMGPAIAEFAAGEAAMVASAAAVGGGSGLLGLLGWGGGAFGFAAFGSVLSLAGFGFEHLATTVLGLAGSLSGALVGGLTLAAGALTTMGVGMLTDMAGIGQAMGDIQQYTTLQNNLNQAIAVYGANSTEAALAQYQMNQFLKDLSPATIQAIQAASNTASAFHAMFDQVTAQAETTGAQIINTLMLLGEKFLPIIGQFAAQNMKLIQEALQPLEQWLSTTGLTIFTQLEVMFSTSLPSAIRAFTNGLELLIKILGYAAGQGGGFLAWADQFFAKWNSSAEWPTVVKGINIVIGLFHTWWDLLKQIGVTIFDLFSRTAGLGTSIVGIITQMLVKLDAWITSTSGNSSLRNLFQVHLQEVKALLKLLPELLGSFAQLYLIIGPDLTQIVAWLADAVNWMLKIPGAGPILAWALAIGVLWKTTQIAAIITWVSGAVGALLDFGAAFVIFAGEEGIAAAASVALAAAMDLIPIFALITAIAALVIGLIFLVTHFKQISDFLSGPWQTAVELALSVFIPWIGLPLLIIGHWQQILTFFHNLPGWIMDEIKALPGQIGTLFSRIPGTIVTILTQGLPAILNFFLTLPIKIVLALAPLAGKLLLVGLEAIAGFLKGLIQALPSVLAWFVELPFRILALLAGAALWLIKIGISVITGFVGGLTQAAPTVWNWFLALPGRILGFLATSARWLWDVGVTVIMGFIGGVGTAAPAVWNWFAALPGHIIAFFSALPGDLWNIGVAIMTGFWHGVEGVWNSIYNWLKGVVSTIVNVFKSALGILSPSTVMHELGNNVMLGLQNGLAAGLPGVLGVMTAAAAGIRGSLGSSNLSLTGSASASVLHSLSMAGVPTSGVSSSGMPMLGAGASPGISNSSIAPQYNTTINIPGGANLSPQTIAAAVAQGLAQHDNDLMRQMGASPRVGAMR